MDSKRATCVVPRVKFAPIKTHNEIIFPLFTISSDTDSEFWFDMMSVRNERKSKMVSIIDCNSFEVEEEGSVN